MTQEQQHEALRLAQHTPMEIKAGRVLCDASAEACGQKPDEHWQEMGQSWTEDAKTMLDACGATGLLQAVRSIAAITTCADQDHEAMGAEIQGICRVALAALEPGERA